MSGDDSIYLLILGSGFFGGFGHCIGMCGPLIATYTITIGESPFKGIKPYFAYHSGRLLSYSLIGGFMGLTGSFVGGIKIFLHIQIIAMVLTGMLMIIMGLSILKSLPSLIRLFTHSTIKPLNHLIKLIKAISDSGSLFPLGLINGIIPCGLSYTAFIAAAGVGAMEKDHAIGFLKGMLLLLLFGMGTLPSLTLLSQFVSKGMAIVRKRFYSIAGVFMIVSGMIFIYRAFYSW